jgi:hypothetical protein
MFQLQQPSAERDSLAETFAGCSQGVIKVRFVGMRDITDGLLCRRIEASN